MAPAAVKCTLSQVLVDKARVESKASSVARVVLESASLASALNRANRTEVLQSCASYTRLSSRK